MWAHARHDVPWRSKVSFQELVLSIHHGIWSPTQVVMAWQVPLPAESPRCPIWHFPFPFLFKWHKIKGLGLFSCLGATLWIYLYFFVCFSNFVRQGLSAQPWYSGIHYVEQAGLELTETHPPLHPRCEPPCPQRIYMI